MNKNIFISLFIMVFVILQANLAIGAQECGQKDAERAYPAEEAEEIKADADKDDFKSEVDFFGTEEPGEEEWNRYTRSDKPSRFEVIKIKCAIYCMFFAHFIQQSYKKVTGFFQRTAKDEKSEA